jgi:hypothetical protein
MSNSNTSSSAARYSATASPGRAGASRTTAPRKAAEAGVKTRSARAAIRSAVPAANSQ